MPSLSAIDKTWALSFREELHAVDAVVAGQGIAICSDVVVLPGYGFYLVTMAQHVRHADIEAFAAWMGTAD